MHVLQYNILYFLIMLFILGNKAKHLHFKFMRELKTGVKG
jgi:hypothetical protein